MATIALNCVLNACSQRRQWKQVVRGDGIAGVKQCNKANDLFLCSWFPRNGTQLLLLEGFPSLKKQFLTRGSSG